ncbi:hypothetical protein [Mucilaginibacter gossypiicola]|nr:hypothetical protein [Mucilaginibacter gossypiicola]
MGRYEGSSSTSMTAIQGEEDASYLSMTKRQISFLLQIPWDFPIQHDIPL